MICAVKYYYHITENNWGKQKTLLPRSNGDNRGVEESKTPRICVSPSIAQCMVAIYCYGNDWFVYRTKKKVNAKEPISIADAHITDEKWLCKKTAFVRVGKIRNKIVKEYADRLGQFKTIWGNGDPADECIQRRWLKKFRSLDKKNKLLTRL